MHSIKDVKLKNNIKKSLKILKGYSESIIKSNDDYYFFLENNDKIVKVVDRKKLDDQLKEDIEDIKLDPPSFLTQKYKNIYKHMTKDEYIKKFTDYKFCKNESDNFFANHYNNLKNFPKLLEITKDYYIFDYIEEDKEKTKITKNDFKDIYMKNLKYFKDHNLFIDYLYDEQDIVINNKRYYFINIKNFHISNSSKGYLLFNNWPIIKFDDSLKFQISSIFEF